MLFGCDISEHQRTFPAGAWDFVIIRTLNEFGREDSRWRAHKAEADRRGIPAGAYVIIDPDDGPTADFLSDVFIHQVGTGGWALVPWVDIELPGGGLRRYAARIAERIHSLGGIVGGYYSAGSHFRRETSDLFDRQWLAAWGSGPFPAGAHVHQYRGAPLDLNRAPSLDPIRLGASTPTDHGDDDLPYSETELMKIVHDGLLLSLRGDPEIRNELAAIQSGATLLILRGNDDVRAEIQELVREAVSTDH